MNRSAVLVAVLAAIAAAWLMWVGRPDSGPPAAPASELSASPAPPPLMVPANPRAPPSLQRPPVPYGIRADGTPGPLIDGPPLPINPLGPVPRDQELPSDARGLTTAAISRRADLEQCARAYRTRTGQRGYEGRFTIELTLDPSDEGGADVSATVVNGPEDPSVDDCVTTAFADARFHPPDHRVMVRWPVPMVD